MGNTKWIRAVLDTSANNVKFYTSTDGSAWTQLGATVSAGGVGIATAGAANESVYAGSVSSLSGIDGSAESLKFHEIQIIDGATGQILCPTMPDQWSPNYTDRVTYAGSPVLSIYNASQPGADTIYWTEARLKKILPREMAAVIYALGTNDTFAAIKDYSYPRLNFDTWLARIRNVCPGASVVGMTQNPLGTEGDTAEHSNRYKVQSGYLAHLVQAIRSYGFPVIDAYSAMLERGFDNTWLAANDAFHPNSTTYQVWAQIAFDAIFTRASE